jgi:solute carrier family 25 (peroxisomal adenine nucleotide transporter), member 17
MPESIASEVLSASLGGAVSASVLYPLEVLKTKMQAETKKEGNDQETESSEKDPSQFTMIEYSQYLYQNHGMGVFFAGVETSAFQSATEKALYFFAYTFLKNGYKAVSHQRELSSLTTLGLGCLAEWAHLPVTLPLDCWTTKIQTDMSGKSPMQLLLLMLSEKVRTSQFYTITKLLFNHVLCRFRSFTLFKRTI